MMKAWKPWAFGLLLSLGLLSCSTEFDPTAPPQDIWVVYGVLNPDDTVQYVRVSMAFLPESDAFVYARENDQSIPGLLVTLTEEGSQRVIEAEPVDSVLTQPEDGLFYPYVTLYKFRTLGPDRLSPGESYQLTVREPGNETFELTATTDIPPAANISTPNFQGGPGLTTCLQQVPIEADYLTFFSEGDAASYELRVILDYTANGEARQAVFGPTSAFSSDVRCSSSGSLCYEFEEKTILRSFRDQIDAQPNVVYRYDVTPENRCRNNRDNLPKVFNFEVTSMDRHITRYRQSNAPRLTDANTIANQYTNIVSSDGTITLGILGSYSTSRANARLSPCSEYLLGLNDTPQPRPTCEF